ncbi:membrane dipeptidase [Roseovarius sp.]|jgi:membrane dipeptidase|uniref:dipeptidase n=1 Tax=Roseovarius sp. TaxID=1486281 RepID=UPI0026184E05|nr:membrane dipeptidase [Roseovarius sp.]MDM8165637.1 membrane dipeptidase [Roseovarius sp.]
MLIIDALQYNNPERARFEEWRDGGVGCVHVTLAIWENARETLTAIGQWNRHFEEHADLIALATTAEEIEEIAASGRTAVVYGFQDTSPFEDDIELIEIFHQLGVRIAQLTYNVQNRVASGCWEPDELGVSKFFGRNVIEEMNRLGMVVDVSHCTEQTCFDAIEYSSRPIAVTHANPQEFVGTDIELNRRNKSTELIRKLAETGGVIGLSNYPKIMKDGSNCTLDTFLDMMAWTVDLVGADTVGLGTDFYDGWPESQIKWWRAGRWARESAIPIKGFSDWPAWFRNSRDFPNIIEGMQKRGFSQAEIEKIVGGNWLRFFRDGFKPASAVS